MVTGSEESLEEEIIMIKPTLSHRSVFFGLRFKRMPFGLRNAPATFQRLIDRLRISVDNVKMLAYLDYLIIFSSTFNDHIEDLNKIFQKFRNKVSWTITPDGLNMDPEKQRL